MTRETKIGLLVGLAFIIVIGILLSDHLTSATDPPQAALVQAGNNVRSAVAVPGGAGSPVTQIQVPNHVTPQGPVATRAELNRQPPVTMIHVEPAGNPQNATSSAQQPQQSPQAAGGDQPIAAVDGNAVPTARGSSESGGSSLESVARTMQEPVVPTGSQQSTEQPGSRSQELTAIAGERQHKAEPGDTVSKLAAKFLGSNTKSNRQLIIDANPTLKQAPDRVIVGKTYVIPAAGGAPTTSAPRPVDGAAPVQPTRATLATATPEHVYTVKPGDTLTRIAIEQLGTADAVSAIVELNKLKDANTIHADMKLRLPAKPLAMAH